MEIFALVIALISLLVVFDTPRNWIARRFNLTKKSTPRPQLAKNETISVQSVVLFISTDHNSLELDLDIAGALATTVAPFVGDGRWLTDKVEALHISNIGQLGALLTRHEKHARLLAHAFSEERTIARGHGLDLVLQMEAMHRYGVDWHSKFLAPLRLTSASQGYATELYGYYQAALRSRA